MQSLKRILELAILGVLIGLATPFALFYLLRGIGKPMADLTVAFLGKIFKR